jgi:hypothetical protein
MQRPASRGPFAHRGVTDSRRARRRGVHDTLHWFWVSTTFGCGGVACDDDGIVVDAAPIYRRTAMGRHINDVLRGYHAAGRLLASKRLPP